MTSLARPESLLSEDDHSAQDGLAAASSSVSEPAKGSDLGFIDTAGRSRTKRLSRLAKRAKAKTKNLLGIDGVATDADAEGDEESPLKGISHNPAFNLRQITKSKQPSPTAAAEKARDAIKSVGSALAHPKNAVKGKITRTTADRLSKTERPYLFETADHDYLKAHDNLKRAESRSSSIRGISDDDEQDAIIGSYKDKLREMEAHRESLRVAWITSRFVRRVRVVPKRHVEFPKAERFAQCDVDGHVVRYHWLELLGYTLIYYTQDFSAQYIDDFDELPFSVNSVRQYIERLVMASAPWQSWAMKVRSVYRWEDPRTTGKWFALYVSLWYTEHIMAFFYGYIIYYVVKNRFYPTSVGSIRSSMQRAQDSRSTAYKLSELIDKHGRANWLEPLIANLGPYIQLQLGDLANMLEVFSNFYQWRSPRKTVATLVFFMSCFLVSVFADMAFCMKIVYFIAGGAFFLCFPIASRYPKYRYLVSPFKWVLWDIPTDAEWSFQYLRRKGQEAREQMIKEKVEHNHNREIAEPPTERYTGRVVEGPIVITEGDEASDAFSYDSDDSGFYSASSTASVLESNDVRSFYAHYRGVAGRFIVFSKGIRFVRSLKKKEIWRHDFLELMEMRKVEGTQLSKIVSSQHNMQINCIDGSRLDLVGMRERDEAFNTVIAFSSLQWQSLQINENAKDQEV